MVLRVYTAGEEVGYLRPPSTWHTLHPLTQMLAKTLAMRTHYTNTRDACHLQDLIGTARMRVQLLRHLFCKSNRQVVQLFVATIFHVQSIMRECLDVCAATCSMDL